MNLSVRLTYKRIAVVAVGGLALAGGAVYAAIPDSNGVIHGCIDRSSPDKRGWVLRVIDTAERPACPAGMESINWNQTGPQGLQGNPGAQGAQGAKGDPGPAGTAAGYANISATGDVNEATSFNITDANVTHPLPGVYCISGLPFEPKVGVGNGGAGITIQADGTVVPSPDRTLVQVFTLPPGSAGSGGFLALCEPLDAPTFTAQVRVFVHSFSANALADRGFRILLED